MKPVKNADENFEENLKSFYQLDYPDYEMVFGVETEDCEDVKRIRKVAAEFPQIKTTIVFTGTDKELNPKVDNLMKMEEFTKGTHYWIADANVRVKPGTLKKLMSEYVRYDSKIVFSPIRGAGSRTLASLAENMHLSYTVSGLIINAWVLAGRQITVGKSMLIEKETLVENFGGFSYFLKYLAEDYVLGRKYEKRKLKITTNYTWITNINSTSTIKSFYSRIARWAGLRHNMDFKWFMAEIVLLNPVIWLIPIIFSGNSILFSAGITVILAKMGAELINLIYMNRKSWECLKLCFYFPAAFFLKEFVIFFTYLAPFFSRKVNWRGRKIRIGKNSIINYEESPEVTMDEI
jgi:ceramide glucosyltransferase